MAEESFYKVRVHRSLMRKVIDKNFPVFLEHIHAKVQRDVFLSEVDVSLTDVVLQIKPDIDRNWDQIATDVFFDQGQIVTEVGGLHYEGTGTLTDPSTGHQETLTISAPLDLVQLVLALEQELTDDGFVWPKVDVAEVVFALKQDLFKINLEGDLPVYKNARFEEAIKKWLTASLAEREADFKIAMQLSEREIMSSFAFRKELGDSKAHSSLSEALNVDDNNVIISYHTEFEGDSLKPLKN